MKRTASAIPLLLMILYSVLPLCRIAALILGYNFTLYNYPVYLAVLAFFSLIAAVYFIAAKLYPMPGFALLAFLLPLSVLNAILAIKYCEFYFILLFLAVSIGSSVVLFYKSAYSVTKILSAAATGILLIIFLALSFFHSVFGRIGKFGNDVAVKSVPSPDNSYTAEVIGSDQGALGGNTFVDVQFNSESVNVLFGAFTKPSERIYSGKYGEYETIQISWKDNQTLLINGTEYKIDD